MSHYIKSLIEQGEHQMLDFKFEISDSRKIARTLSAFANTQGGTLLIGVKDNGRIAGIRSEEEYYMAEAAAQLYCKPEISITAEKWNVEGKTILEVKISKGDHKPYYAKDEKDRWLAYIRINDQNILANPVWLKVWKRKAGPTGILIRYSESEQTLLSYLQENKEITLSKFMKIARLRRFEAEDVLANMIVSGMLDIIQTERSTSYFLSTKMLP